MKFENVFKIYLPRCIQASSIHFYLTCLLLSHISLHIFVMHWIVEAAGLRSCHPIQIQMHKLGFRFLGSGLKSAHKGENIYRVSGGD